MVPEIFDKRGAFVTERRTLLSRVSFGIDEHVRARLATTHLEMMPPSYSIEDQQQALLASVSRRVRDAGAKA